MHAALWIVLLGSSLAVPGLPTPVAWSPDGKWLAFTQDVRPVRMPVEPGWLFATGEDEAPKLRAAVETSRPATSYRLWASRPETGESVLLEDSRNPLSAPCWNRDGTSLAFGRLVRSSEG